MKSATLGAVAMLLALTGGDAIAQPLGCEECVVQAPPPKASGLLLEVDLGGVYTYALGRSFAGARVDLAVGREFASGFTIDGRLGFEAGGSESGLPYQRLSWGPGIGGRVAPRVRLALEARLGMISIDRATDPGIDHAMMTMTVGLHGEVVVALIGPGRRDVRASAGGLDLIARVGYDGWVLDDASDWPRATVSAKLGLGGHF